jgi:endogenous inhibitor of DNA gyrase (YacG/DUF329 family)
MRCPTCKRESVQSRWRPFCSERCKLIDLDNWLSGRYRISRPFTHDDEAEVIRPAEPLEPTELVKPAKEDRG